MEPVVLDEHIEHTLTWARRSCDRVDKCADVYVDFLEMCPACKVTAVIEQLQADVRLLDQFLEAAALTQGLDREIYEQCLGEFITMNPARMREVISGQEDGEDDADDEAD